MMPDWNAYLGQLSARIKELSQLAPDAVAGFNELKAGANKTPHLEAKTRELIAIAVTTRCDGCIGVHTKRAIKAGATRQEIAETLGVAIALNAGAALTYSARVLDAYAAIGPQPEDKPPPAPGTVESLSKHREETPQTPPAAAPARRRRSWQLEKILEESPEPVKSPPTAPKADEGGKKTRRLTLPPRSDPSPEPSDPPKNRR
jgi:AhpD family alkylhydroperoxidase